MNWLAFESYFRLGFFASGLLVFWLAGLLFSFRSRAQVDTSRWFHNTVLTLFNSLLMRVLLPISLVALADQVSESKLGLMNWLGLGQVPNLLLSLVLLDCVIYFQHIVFHKVPWLWRLHRVHHSDIGSDTTTALRFPPIEIGLSLVVKAFVIVALGVSPAAIVVFEVLLNFSAMFNHANFSLPKSFENFLKVLIVTPDMHRIHHSVRQPETDSNFGFCLSVWDRLFQTFTARSALDLQADNIGLAEFRTAKDQQVHKLLMQPFQALSPKSSKSDSV